MSLALIGWGPWGQNLLREVDSLAEASVVAVCETDHLRLRQLRECLPHVRAGDSLEAVLSDSSIDGVLIATPPASHFELALLALRADKHVYAEKLLGLEASQAVELDKLARSRGRVLMVGHVCIHDPVVEKLAEEVRGGVVGRVRHIRSTRASLGRLQHEVNVVWDLAPHDLSMLHRLMGRLPDEVAVHARAYVGRQEEVASVFMSYDEGPTVELSLSWLDAAKERHFTVLGEKGALRYDALDALQPLRFQGGSVDSAGAGLERTFVYKGGEERFIPVRTGGDSPLVRLGRHFVGCMKTGALPVTGGPEGAAILAVLDACDRSVAAGGLSVRLAPRHPAEIVRAAETSGS